MTDTDRRARRLPELDLGYAWQEAESALPKRVDGTPAVSLRLERNLGGTYLASTMSSGSLTAHRYRTLRPFVKSRNAANPYMALLALAAALRKVE